jgi:[acyl-carrier-protein] S-malonyltransferase
MPELKPPVALLFPGQGVQRPGMGARLYDRYPAARRAFEAAEAVLGMPVRRLCFEGPAEELNRTDVLQPCVLTVSWAAHEVWLAEYPGEPVVALAGHSLGQFAALAAAGCLEWADALLAVRERGRIMAAAGAREPGAMLAVVGLDEERIEAIRRAVSGEGEIWFANRNAPDQFVLSGRPAAIAAAEQLALDAGARRALVLAIPLAAHSPLMAQAGAEFAAVVDALPLRPARLALLANGDGRVIAGVGAVRAEMRAHLLRPVDWASTLRALAALGIGTAVELGPGRVLASLAAKHIPGVETWNSDELFLDFAEPALPVRSA